MVPTKERYKWFAEKPDGSIVDMGGDLSGCSKFVLEPAEGVRLPRHEFNGIVFERRFCRNAVKSHFNAKDDLPGKIFWSVGSWEQKTTEDLTGCLKRGDFVGKGVDGEEWYLVGDVKPDRIILLTPYKGKTKVNGMMGRKIELMKMANTEMCCHCIICQDFKIWVNYSDGAVIITDKSTEINL